MGYKVSNNYLYEFEQYTYSVFLGISIPKFDYSEIKQAKSDKKLYAIDTGLLSAMEFSMSQNRGKLLENTVLLELIKSDLEVYYFKDKFECDFVVKKGMLLQPIQVCWQIDNESTQIREIRALIEVCRKIKVTKAQLISFDQKRILTFDEIEIQVIPFYEWVREINYSLIINY